MGIFDEAMEGLRLLNDRYEENPEECVVCHTNIDENYNWFIVKNSSGTESIICGYNCLKGFYNKNKKSINNCQLIEHSRCAAYFGCKKVNNLRGKCFKTYNLTEAGSMGVLYPTNFCEPAEAGIIMSSDSINQTLEKFSEESKKQYKTTRCMTVLVIFLSVINVGIAIVNYYFNADAEQLDQLRKIDNNLEKNSNYIQQSKDNMMNLLKK